MDDGGQVLAGGAPLGFYHFTGLDSGNHEVALQYATNDSDIEGSLVQNYREALAEAERYYPYSHWSFGRLADGSEVNVAWRRAYRDNTALQARFPDPWQSSDLGSACEASAKGIRPGYISPGYAVRTTRQWMSHGWGATYCRPSKSHPVGWPYLSRRRAS